MQIHSEQRCAEPLCAVGACAAQQWLCYYTLDATGTGGTESSAVPDAAVLLLATASRGQQTLHSSALEHCSAAHCVLGWAASRVSWTQAHTDAASVQQRHTSASNIQSITHCLHTSLIALGYTGSSVATCVKWRASHLIAQRLRDVLLLSRSHRCCRCCRILITGHL